MRWIIYISVVMLWGFGLYAQPTFPMSTQTVNLCEGRLTDSETGTPSGNYNHNENLVFTICPSGADSIILSFSSFCTEAGLDMITFFDGPDTLSPMIGLPHSGTSLPPTILATSGCLTIRFKSDASVNCSGWNAHWRAVIVTPDPPVITPIPAQNCSTNFFILQFDQPVRCDSLRPSHFNILGPSGQAITSVVPDAPCVGGYTNRVRLNYNPGLIRNGTYTIVVNSYFQDPCGKIWRLSSSTTVAVTNCPLQVLLESPDSLLCAGDCTVLIAEASGGSGTYTYTWSPAMPPGPGPHSICPATSTLYRVTVTDGTAAPAGYDSLFVTVTPLPTVPADFTVCQTDPIRNLSATPTGGIWRGPGITNGTLGTFNPNAAGTGVRVDTYFVSGCSRTFRVTINPMDAGLPRAACPGSAPFSLVGNPAGGVWSGTGISIPSPGTFSPALSGLGTHRIIYTVAASGCPPDTAFVYVDSLWVQNDTQVCSNSRNFRLTGSPYGGRWTGPGIVDGVNGVFNASAAGPGIKRIIYNLNGCSDTLFVTVTSVEAQWDRTACPSQDTFRLNQGLPTGGYWTGLGIIDSNAGLFNPRYNSSSPFNSMLLYHVGACTDTMIMYTFFTDVLPGPNSRCTYDGDVILDWPTTNRNPWGGIWRGTAIVDSSTDGRFRPGLAGPGTYRLVYTANTCSDTFTMIVHPDPLLHDTTICDRQSPFNLYTALPGGVWSGPGIVNPLTGLFNPGAAGIGNHSINYRTPQGCVYGMRANVTSVPVVSISGLPAKICFRDTSIALNGTPAGGRWGGASSGPVFNPFLAGSGVHTITYSYGSGDCAVSSSLSIQVDDTLELFTAYTDTILCNGGDIRLSAWGEGGDLSNYLFTWSGGIGAGPSLVIQASSTQVYQVNLTDGCVPPLTANVFVFVHPPITLQFDTSTIRCYQDTGWCSVSVTPDSVNYTYVWSSTPPQYGPYLSGLSGNVYGVTVTDDSTGCKQSGRVKIPSYSKISAGFVPTPQGYCPSMQNPEYGFIDLSENAVIGSWWFGDGDTQNYVPGLSMTHRYPQEGVYRVFLQVENEGGCKDWFTDEVCIDPYTEILVPTGFTPDGDGLNDLFRVRWIGVGAFKFRVFNRWGELVFETDSPDDGWDGNFRGRTQPMDTYAYTIDYFSKQQNRMKTLSGQVTLLR